MLNIHELETKWLHYKIKSYIPHAIITISLFIIILIVSLVEFNNTEKTTIKKVTINNKKDILNKQTVIKETPKVKAPKTIKKDKEIKVVMSPSLNFIKNIHNSPHRYYEKNENLQKKSVKTKTILKTTKQKEVIKIEVPKVEIVKKQAIKIKRQNTHTDIQHVISRFKKSNNPALSLFIAKKYYELGDYSKAYNYALITNELNNEIEDSWIIFAKSLFKLNKKAKAIETLNRYIRHSNSHKAKLLLDNIRLGKIK